MKKVEFFEVGTTAQGEQVITAVIFNMFLNNNEINTSNDFYNCDGRITDTKNNYKGNITSILYCDKWYDLRKKTQRKVFFKEVKKAIKKPSDTCDGYSLEVLHYHKAIKTVKTAKNLAALYFDK